MQSETITQKRARAQSKSPFETGILSASSFAVALLTFFLVNLCLLGISNQQPKHFDLSALNQQERMFGRVGSWWLARGYLQQAIPSDVFIFGSSQMGGLQCADARVLGRNIDFTLDHESVALERELNSHLQTKVAIFNGAIPGAIISDHLVISRAMFSDKRKPKLAIIGFSPRDFIDNTCPSPTSTEAFMFFSKFANLDKQFPLFFSNLLDQLQWQISQRLPLRNSIQPLLSSNSTTPSYPKRKTATGQQAMMYKPFEPMEPGQCTIGPNPAKIFVDNTEDYSHRYRNCFNGTLQQQLNFFKLFCSQMKDSNIKVVAVGMPLLPSNRALLPPKFWQYFVSQIEQTCQNSNATWFNFCDSPSLGTDDFFDTVHLNTEGGLKFAKMLAEKMNSEPCVAAALKNNR